MASWGGKKGIDSSGGEMEAAEKSRREKQMEERNKRVVLREERKAKKEEEEKKAARAKAARQVYAKHREEMRKMIEERKHKEPWEKFRDFWMQVWGEGGHFGEFEDETAIPPMRLTFSDYGDPMETLQFFSVKVARIDESLHWPLDVYGFVAIRDVVDHRRNMIFCRNRNNCQTINQQDPYLALTGPTRAVAVSSDPSYFEIKLKVKGSTESEDKDLIILVVTYITGCKYTSFPSKLSTLEITFQEIVRSVEATISVKVIDGSWPDGFRGVFSASIDSIDDLEVKLLECGDDKLPFDADDGKNRKIRLTRRVVSVELDGFLRISAMAHPIHGGQVVKSPQAVFAPKSFGTSSNTKLKIGSCKMEVTVGWSLFCYHP